MRDRILIIPGFHGSGPAHWQTWLEGQAPDAQRVSGIDWDAPVLQEWVESISAKIESACGPVWLVAHSFGCLAAVCSGFLLAEKVAGALLVAPADPERFTEQGARMPGSGQTSLSARMPSGALPFPSLLVASSNDPWLSMLSAAYWSDCWASRLVSIGRAGHINAEAGYGPWPEGLRLLLSLQRARGDLPLGQIVV